MLLCRLTGPKQPRSSPPGSPLVTGLPASRAPPRGFLNRRGSSASIRGSERASPALRAYWRKLSFRSLYSHSGPVTEFAIFLERFQAAIAPISSVYFVMYMYIG